MGVTASDLDWWLDLAPRLRWTFAKTMPMIPHESSPSSTSSRTT